MSLSQEKLNQINNKKIISFLSPLLLGIQDDESYLNKLDFNMNNKLEFDFNKSFIMFSNIQVYRHVSILGILKSFSRSLKYETLNLALLLDIWYNESTIISKDKLRTCDLLIIHGTNDVKFGINKAMALIDLINTRKSYGKLTWIFIHGISPETYSQFQPGVLSEITNIYKLKFGESLNLIEALSNLEEVTLLELKNNLNNLNDTSDNHLV